MLSRQFGSIFVIDYLCNDSSNQCGSKSFLSVYEFFSRVTSISWMKPVIFPFELFPLVECKCLKHPYSHTNKEKIFLQCPQVNCWST